MAKFGGSIHGRLKFGQLCLRLWLPLGPQKKIWGTAWKLSLLAQGCSDQETLPCSCIVITAASPQTVSALWETSPLYGQCHLQIAFGLLVGCDSHQADSRSHTALQRRADVSGIGNTLPGWWPDPTLETSLGEDPGFTPTVLKIIFITLEENPQVINSSEYLIFPINSVSIH